MCVCVCVCVSVNECPQIHMYCLQTDVSYPSLQYEEFGRLEVEMILVYSTLIIRQSIARQSQQENDQLLTFPRRAKTVYNSSVIRANR